MRKLSLILVLILCFSLLSACSSEKEAESLEAFSKLVGAWQLKEESNGEYYIFTEDKKVQIHRGAVCLEGDAEYYSKLGVNYYYSEFQYFYGLLTFTVEGDTATFEDDKGVVTEFVRAEYKEAKISPYTDFIADEALVGEWTTADGLDKYTFTAEGLATNLYTGDYEELGYRVMCTYSYKILDDKTMVFLTDTGSGESEFEVSCTLSGGKLNLDGAEYSK